MQITPARPGPLARSHDEAGGGAAAASASAPASASSSLPEPGAGPSAAATAPPAADASVDKIRDILFGVQMRDYDDRFSGVDARLTREVAELREETSRRFDQLQQFIRQELDTLHQRLTEEQRQRNESLHTLGQDLRQQLAALSEDVHSSITNRFNEVTASLERQSSNLRHEKTDRATLAALLTDVAQRLAQTPGQNGQ